MLSLITCELISNEHQSKNRDYGWNIILDISAECDSSDKS